MSAPTITVVIPAYHSQDTIADTLLALRGQACDVIVVDSSSDTATADVVRRFPEVALHSSPERLLPHAARNLGAALARGEAIAFTDPDCVPAPDWIEVHRRALSAGRAVVGGPIHHPGADGDWRVRAIHATKFSGLRPGRPSGPKVALATGNLAIDARAFARLGGFDEANRWAGDTELSWRAARAGLRPWFEAGALVVHADVLTPRAFLRERLVRGADFAEMRAAVRGWPRRVLVARALAAPVAWVVLIARAARSARAADGRPLGARALALVAAGCAAWSLGEATAFARRTAART